MLNECFDTESCMEVIKDRANTIAALTATIAQLREDQAVWLAVYEAWTKAVSGDETWEELVSEYRHYSPAFRKAMDDFYESGALDRARQGK